MGRPGKSKSNVVEQVCIVLLLLIAGYVLLNSSFFNIREILVTGNKSLTVKEITDASGIPIGENIFKVDLREATSRLKLLPVIKEVRLERHFPGRVRIEVTEREPVALVSRGGDFYGLDDTGVCIGRFNAAFPLPVVTGAGSAPKPGGVLKTEGFSTAVLVLKYLDKNLVSQLAEIHVTPSKTVEAYTTEGVKIYFGRPEMLAEKNMMLCGILKTLGGRKVVYIDLTAAKRPVVKFAGKGVTDRADNPPFNDAGSTVSGAYGGGSVPAFPRD